MDESMTTAPAPPETGPPEHQPVFNGSGDEYFRIWIVNLLLSIVTLGIYSAWATVRNRRYLYGSTTLDGHHFDFHANPIPILKGRVLAVALLLIYLLGGYLHVAMPPLAAAAFVLGFPWLMVSSFRFRLYNSSYRGIRFGFLGRPIDAYKALWVPVLMFITAFALIVFSTLDTLGVETAPDELPPAPQWGMLLAGMLLNFVAVPFFARRMQSFMLNNLAYGDQAATAQLALGPFWAAFGVVIGLGFLAGFIGTVAAVLVGLLAAVSNNLVITMILIYIVFGMAYLLPWAAWHCRISNYTTSQTSFGAVRLRLALELGKYYGILVGNAFIAICTLGLAIPYTKVRMIRYKLSRLTVIGDLDTFTGSSSADPSALGEEIAEAFDIEVGF